MRSTHALALALFLACAPSLAAQQKPYRASLFHRVEGDQVRAAIELRVDPGWHVYHEELGPPDAVGLPTRVQLSGEGIEWGPVVFPTPKRKDLPGLGEKGGDTWVWAHAGKVVLRSSGRLADAEQEPEVGATVKGQVCEEEGLCILLDLALQSKGEGADELFADFPWVAPAREVVEKGGDEAEGTDELRGRLWVRSEGGRARAVIRLEIEEGWHLYHDDLGPGESFSLPTRVELGGEGVRWGKVFLPEPKLWEDDFGQSALAHEGTIDLRAEGELEGASEPREVVAHITGQVCSNVCLQVDLRLAALGPGPDEAFAWTTAGAPSRSGSKSGSSPTGAVASGAGVRSGSPPADPAKGLLAFLLLAVGGGLFALLMPCTYPMIPITISFFTKQADAREGRVLPLALAYGAGIVLIFVLIGVAVGPVVIAFATHPITNLVIGILFLVFALVLFGVFELRPPRFLMDAAGKASMHGGYFGVFLMGATLVVSSFTCTAPFVGSLLSFGAVEGGSLVRVALGMAVFGLTMAVPFVALSLLPGKARQMPRSGEWMNTLKVTLGFVEVAAALKFISNTDIIWKWDTLSRELFLVLWAGIFALCAAYLFGWVRLQGHATGELSAGRMTGGIASVLFALYCWHGAQGHRMDEIMTAIIPPYSSRIDAPGVGSSETPASQKKGHEVVEDDYELARTRAIGQGKLLLVNFTGHTCVNCRMMEQRVFPESEVNAELRGMVEARLHNDGDVKESIKTLQLEMTGEYTTPIYLVVEPRTRRVLGKQRGATSAANFARFLRESAARAGEAG